MATSEPQTISAEQIQKEHYDRIGQQYTAHYSDRCSLQYRAKFICEPMFAGIELSGLQVLDAMCGSGELTQFLMTKGAVITGLDISPKEISSFQEKWPTCKAVCDSVLSSSFDSSSFDCIAIVGGLHHLHPKVSDAIVEVHRILKPGGHLCFAEPHAGSLPEFFRRKWYKHDHLFSDNEAGIDVRKLKDEFSTTFTFKGESYLGNVGYLFILNSMIFRIPLPLKPFYAPILMRLEALINKLQGKLTSCYVVAQWQKK